MQNVLALMGLLTMLGLSSTAAQQTGKPVEGETCTLTVEKMHCNACAERVRKVALNLEGVTAATVSQPKGLAEIAYNAEKTNPKVIAKQITDKTGFKTEVQQKK